MSPNQPFEETRRDIATIELRPWTLPLIVAAILVPIVAGFAIGGAGVGTAFGMIAAATLVVVAARAVPDRPIEVAESHDDRRHVLVVLGSDLDDSRAAGEIARRVALPDAEHADVRVLVPTDTGVVERWTGATDQAQERARRRLARGVAELCEADVSAAGGIGNSDLVQSVEDELRTFPATEVVLATGPLDSSPETDRAADELDRRLSQPFSRLVVA